MFEKVTSEPIEGRYIRERVGHRACFVDREMSFTRVVGSLIAAVVACVCATATGCGHGALTPAPSASLVPNAPTAAFSVVEGVRCSANVGAWTARDGEFPEFVVPVKVRIKNASGKPIQVLYEDFMLLGRRAARTGRFQSCQSTPTRASAFPGSTRSMPRRSLRCSRLSRRLRQPRPLVDPPAARRDALR